MHSNNLPVTKQHIYYIIIIKEITLLYKISIRLSTKTLFKLIIDQTIDAVKCELQNIQGSIVLVKILRLAYMTGFYFTASFMAG